MELFKNSGANSLSFFGGMWMIYYLVNNMSLQKWKKELEHDVFVIIFMWLWKNDTLEY